MDRIFCGPRTEVHVRGRWRRRTGEDILDRASGEILSSFGRAGHQLGEFTHVHTLAVDSKGNVYVAETDWGRRVQKFKPVSVVE
ncbi:hypothetical protein [Bradyrhizobium sp.]|uniref:hypothetical protein n=1 Tax=Bradyrhizobium sp. TaxID=376 RepID=UPI003C172A30